MDRPRRPSRVITVGLPILGFLLSALTVYTILRHQWPQEHDLSDIGTGMMRFLLALGAGILGALLTHLAIRLAATDRRSKSGSGRFKPGDGWAGEQIDR